MNFYEMIMNIQNRMNNDPQFAQRFNNIINTLNSIPGLQQEVMRISQISDDKKRKKAMDKLPDQAKQAVNDMYQLINGN